MLFKIGDNDYTTHIRQGTYKVNSEELYKSWIDANFIEHRHIYRTKVGGSFSLYFGNQAEFVEFLQRLEAVRNINGYYVVGLMSNNEHEFYPIKNVFVEMSPVREQKVIGEAWYPELVLKVEEL